ncbi:MAG: dolichyl-phosphate-mannose--protein mannosyltransferase [Muribaculaceae bacterium]|nr:dolichyl-phosphate-mannose--protein mannosyltransferase [Muribaculaceae bacterium]
MSRTIRFPWVYFWALLALIPIILLRDFNPSNELRYISIASEALRDGHIFTFYNHGIPYADKPPLYFWLTMGAYSLLGNHCMWLLNMFSILPAFVIAEVMQRWSKGVLSEDFSTESKVLLLTCGLFCGMMVTLRMDMLMTMFIVLALYQAYKIQRSPGPLTWKSSLLFGLWIFLGVFSKGPMGILIPLVSTTVFMMPGYGAHCEYRGWKAWFRVWNWRAWLLLLALCGCWFGAVYAEGGTGYLDNLLFHQTMDRAVDAFHHKRPFWFYARSIWYTMLPWTFLIIGAVILTCIRWKKLGNDIERFYVYAGISTFVLLSFISSKLDIYLIPAYPFFVYLAAIYASRYRTSKWVKASITVPAVILSAALVATWFIQGNESTKWLHCWQLYVAAFVLTIGGIMTIVAIWKKNNLNMAIRSIGISLCIGVFIAGLVVPDINDRLGYGKVSDQAIADAQRLGRDSIYSYRVRRGENIDVYAGSKFRQLPDTLSESEMAEYLRNGIIITRSKWLPLSTGGKELSEPVGDHYVVYAID